jgi:hypothetical protein
MGQYKNLCDAVHAVATNLALLDNDQRERVLMSVAVLYGIVPIIKEPAAPEPGAEPKETP